MCYDVILVESADLAGLRQRYKDIRVHYVYPELTDQIQLPKYYHVSGFEHPKLPVITKDAIDYKVEFMEWDLIPSYEKQFVHNAEINRLNARGESINSLVSFRDAFRKRNFGILPVSAFYESQHYNGFKIPHLVYDLWDDYLNIAVLFDTWTDKLTGEIKKSFSILTTEAAGIMRIIHNSKLRMPVIFPDSFLAYWLNPEISEKSALKMATYQYLALEAHSVSKLANHARSFRNVSDIAQYYEYTEADLNIEYVSRQARKRDARK